MSGTINALNNIPVVGKQNGSRFMQAIKALVGFLLPVISTQFFATSAQAATYAYRNDVFAYDTPSGTALVISVKTNARSASRRN